MTDSQDLLKQIESLITSVYRDRTVNPWDCSGVRSESFEQFFRARLPQYPQRNQTDPIFGGATAIAFLLHPGQYIGVSTRDGVEARIGRLGGECFMALMEISHIGPYARLRFTRETFDRKTRVLGYEEKDAPYREEDSPFYDAIINLLADLEIELLPREVLDHPVPDVELDVTDVGSATIYHCLFDEE